MCELDRKKNEALKNTWVKVNKDFGSIFSTLLPQTNAKLEPTFNAQQPHILEGLEVYTRIWAYMPVFSDTDEFVAAFWCMAGLCSIWRCLEGEPD